jgi:hypothetical protein
MDIGYLFINSKPFNLFSPTAFLKKLLSLQRFEKERSLLDVVVTRIVDQRPVNCRKNNRTTIMNDYFLHFVNNFGI